MSPTLRRHVLPLCAAFGWLWMLLPFHTLGIDALILALLQAALLFSLKRKEQFFIPMLAYPIKLRPMILSDCLRDAGWWIVLTLPLLIPHAGVQLQILLSLALAGSIGMLLEQFIVPDGYLGASTARVNVASFCTLAFLFQMAVNIRQWEEFGTHALPAFLIVWLITFIAAVVFGPVRIRKKVQNAMLLTVFLKQRRELYALLRLRPDQTKDIYCRILQHLLPSRCVRLWRIAAMLPILFRKLFLYAVVLLFSPMFPYLTQLVLIVFAVHLLLMIVQLRKMYRTMAVNARHGG